MGINPTIIQKNLFHSHTVFRPQKPNGTSSSFLIGGERHFLKVQAGGGRLSSQKPLVDRDLGRAKPPVSLDEHDPAVAKKYESVGHLFEAARRYMSLGSFYVSAARKSGLAGLEKIGMEYFGRAVHCLRLEMVLYGYLRPKMEKEKLWEFDPYQVRVLSEHPDNYLLIAKCLCELGDLKGMGEAQSKSREIHRRAQSDPKFAASMRLLELYRKAMDAYFSPHPELRKTIGVLREGQEVLLKVSHAERDYFMGRFKGMFNLKNPFLEAEGQGDEGNYHGSPATDAIKHQTKDQKPISSMELDWLCQHFPSEN